MLVCKIEIWPGGDESQAREIGRALIANVGGDAHNGNYSVRLMKSGEYATSPGVWKRGNVLNFPRLRLGPYDLLLRALAAACGGRSPAAARIGEAARLDDDTIDRVALATCPQAITPETDAA